MFDNNILGANNNMDTTIKDEDIDNAVASIFPYHLNIKYENPCLIDDSSLDCFVYKQFYNNMPHENIFLENLNYIVKHSDIIPFDSKYNYDPYKLSYDYYQTKHFAPLILAVNNIPSILFFTVKDINNFNHLSSDIESPLILLPPISIIEEIYLSYQSNKKE